MAGKVRRQHPVGGFVVDFACVPLRLVIEIDGGVHGRDEVALNDHLRQQAIEVLGWTVVRFATAEALAEPWRIDAAIANGRRRCACDFPLPLGEGLRLAERSDAPAERVRVRSLPGVSRVPAGAAAHAD